MKTKRTIILLLAAGIFFSAGGCGGSVAHTENKTITACPQTLFGYQRRAKRPDSDRIHSFCPHRRTKVYPSGRLRGGYIRRNSAGDEIV